MSNRRFLLDNRFRRDRIWDSNDIPLDAKRVSFKNIEDMDRGRDCSISALMETLICLVDRIVRFQSDMIE